MDNTVWMVVVGEVAAVVHSVTIGTICHCSAPQFQQVLLTSFRLYLVALVIPTSRHCHCGRSQSDGQLLGDCAGC